MDHLFNITPWFTWDMTWDGSRGIIINNERLFVLSKPLTSIHPNAPVSSAWSATE